MEKIKIGNKTFEVEIADTEEKRRIGLSNRKSLPKNQGMLFLFDEEQEEVSFTMKDTSIPLDIIFIDEDGDVISIAKGEPHNEDPYIEYEVSYVLEVNQDSGITEDDSLLLEEDDNTNPEMEILDSKGKVQYKLKGGERIVSRRETKILIKKSKKAKKTNSDSSYRTLARYMFKVLNNQDSREPEYVNQ